MTWDEGIDGPHREIAGSFAARIGVLAGPGTGKTKFGLMRRVARLLETGTAGAKILLISFTRVAAADLRDKVATLEAPGVEDVRASTLHSYCFSLLLRESVLAITGRVPRILLDHEVDLMLRDIDQDYGTIHDRRRMLEAFVAGWARRQQDHPGVAAGGGDVDFASSVMQWLREHRAMLIGEVVPLAHRYLTTNPGADDLSAFEHVVVDEYQDLNALEQALLDTLAANSNLCVAGDDDQSIYSVRYANPEGILEFLAREEVEEHSIDTCGRCPSNIVAMANDLMRQAPGRPEREMKSLTAEDGTVNLIQWTDVDSEVEGLVAAIAQDIGTGRREPGEILVLTNWRRIGERIRNRLKELEIPVRSFFTQEELGSEEARHALALLRLVVNEDDAVALRVIVGLGEGTGRTEAYQRLLGYCRDTGVEPREALTKMSNGERLGLTVPAIVKRAAHAIAQVERLRELELPDLVDALLPDGMPEIADLRDVALDALADAESTSDLLRAIIDAVTQDEVPQNPDFVRVMSLHKSKGLTSPSVYVAGALHGILPTLRADDAGAVEAATREGRRLFFVAITRASQDLTVSWSASIALADASARGVRYDKRSIRNVNGQLTVRTLASPYLSELGPKSPRPARGPHWLASR